MLQIKDTLVSLDLIERYFCCDLDSCLGACCVEGDAGAPVSVEEIENLETNLSLVVEDLTPSARQTIEEQGVAYVDEEGDLVTSIVNGRDCVFCTYAAGGKTLCAFEKAYRDGKTAWCKPMSCHLYPVRLKKYGSFTAVNLHRWKICGSAEKLGRKLGIRAYQFLKEPLISRFGEEWYSELCVTAEEYLRQYNK